MEKGISIEIVWRDQDAIEAIVSCSNGLFSGWAGIYLSCDAFPGILAALRGFPSHPADTRNVELGTFSPNHAGGGVKSEFRCRDSSGHVIVEVRLRGVTCKALGEPESVALHIPIEAAALDSFLAELASIECAAGARAHLPMAI